MTCDAGKVAGAISSLVSRLNQEQESGGRKLSDKEALVLRLNSQYPNDVGVLSAFFLNQVWGGLDGGVVVVDCVVVLNLFSVVASLYVFTCATLLRIPTHPKQHRLLTHHTHPAHTTKHPPHHPLIIIRCG